MGRIVIEVMSIRIRPAAAPDLDFVIEAIVAAERSGTEASSYERVLGLDDSGFRAFLRSMMQANISGSEMSLDGFLLAENGVGPLAAVAAWVEGDGKSSSDYLKGPKMAEVVGLAH